jgi:hypothetical protein
LEYFIVSADGHDVRGEVHFVVGSGVDAVGDAATEGGDAAASTAVTAETRWWERGRAAALPVGLVVLAAVVALSLLHRRRRAAAHG